MVRLEVSSSKKTADNNGALRTHIIVHPLWKKFLDYRFTQMWYGHIGESSLDKEAMLQSTYNAVITKEYKKDSNHDDVMVYLDFDCEEDYFAFVLEWS